MTYYEDKLTELNKILSKRAKLEFLKNINYNHQIEKNDDAEIIQSLRIFQEGLQEDVKPLPEFVSQHISKEGKMTSKINIEAIAQYLLDEYKFLTLFGQKGTRTFLFNDVWEERGESFIKIETEKLINKRCSNHAVSEVLGKIQRKTSILWENFEKTPEKLLPLTNGVYDLEKKVLIKYLPEYYFKYKIPVHYNKEAKCPVFANFLKQVLYEDDIPLMQEWFGFCLYRRYFIKKGMIWVGDRDTGKTTLLNVLVKFVGQSNTAGISLQRVSHNDKFAIASLHNKLVNAYDDLSFKDINDGGGFKILTGGGYCTAEQKFGDPFTFVNHAKQLFVANKIPTIKDLDDEAYYNRWLPVQFDNQISDGDKDPFILDKMTIQEELSGILNWALEGLFRLMKQGKFSFNKNADEIKAIMCRSGNPLYAFSQDVLKESEGMRISKDQMHEIYKVYASENKLTPLTKEQLGRQLGKVAHYLVAKSDVSGRFWENVVLNEKYLENPEISKILDTLDTSKNIICKKKDDSNLSVYINSEKVTKPSNSDDLDIEIVKMNKSEGANE